MIPLTMPAETTRCGSFHAHAAVGVALGLTVQRWDLLALARLAWVVTLLCTGAAVATLVRSQAELGAVTDIGGLFLTVLGGAMVPFGLMPAWLRSVASVSPGYWALDSLRAAMAGDVPATVQGVAVLAGSPQCSAPSPPGVSPVVGDAAGSGEDCHRDPTTRTGPPSGGKLNTIGGPSMTAADVESSAVVGSVRKRAVERSGEHGLRGRILGGGATVKRRILAVAAAAAVGASLTAQPAFADATYHSSHIPLHSENGAPLRSGFVENIHANGPVIFAHEIYVLNGANPDTPYQVTLRIFVSRPDCSGTAVELQSASFTTNPAGNGHGGAIFNPADAAPLRHATHGIIWNVVSESGVAYTTGCQVVSID